MFALTNRSSEKEIQYSLKIITCDPSIYIMDHPNFNVCSFMESSIGLKRVKMTLKIGPSPSYNHLSKTVHAKVFEINPAF